MDTPERRQAVPGKDGLQLNKPEATREADRKKEKKEMKSPEQVRSSNSSPDATLGLYPKLLKPPSLSKQ